MKAFYNQAPLIYNQKALLSPDRIHPDGWLKQQMEIQAESLKEFMKAWPVLEKEDRAEYAYIWQSEDLPKLYEGLIRLAFSLDDETLKAYAKEYAERILKTQTNDGFYSLPYADETSASSVSLQIAHVRSLYTYFTATGDRQILKSLDLFFRYEAAFMDTAEKDDLPQLTAGDNMYLAIKLYNITKQRYLLDICEKLRRNTTDWTSLFHTFPMVQPASKVMPKEKLLGRSESEQDESLRANVYRNYLGSNVAAGLRTPGVVSCFKSGFKEQSGFKTGWEKLSRYHMSANGMFSSDDMLSGASPSAGCSGRALAETMVSMQTLLDAGEFGPELPDALEKLAYNGVPAMWSPDALNKQDVQQTNQIELGGEHHGWYSARPEANAFNPVNEAFSSGALYRTWTSVLGSLWMSTKDGGLSAVSYAPCIAEHVIDDTPVRLRVKGNYPFSESLEIHVAVKKPVEFPMYLRIPSWADNPMICLPGGEIMAVRPGETACIRQKWDSSSAIRLILPRQVRVSSLSHQSAAIEAGPLLMALDLEQEDFAKESSWAWAIDTAEPMKLTYNKGAVSSFKNGDAPISVRAKIYPCPDWKKEGSDAGSIPIQPLCDQAKARAVDLIPYGYTRLRIAQFPAARTEEKHA